MKFSASVLLLGIMGLLQVASREVGAQSPAPGPAPSPGGGPLGHKATSLCTELIEPNGYECHEYSATTGDGFILGIQNMPARCTGAPGKNSPVLLQHGLTAGGDNWVNNSPKESLAYILVDDCFDVWIANSRAIQWSHGHEYLTPADEAYWAWTYDELASYDLKASTELVYNARKQKMSYVGHSLGTTVFFAGLTQGKFNTTIREYVNAGVMLAPIAYSSHQSAPALTATIELYSTPETYTKGAMEYDNYETTQLICGLPLINPTACFIGFTLSVGDTSYTNQSRLGFYTQYFPQPTSTFNLNHLSQGLNRGNFAKYDMGAVNNTKAYGQPTAPNYDVTTFPADLPMLYVTGGIDAIADPKDVAYLLSLLPSSNRVVFPLSNYGHTDPIFGYHAWVDVYPKLIEFLSACVN
ncbi:unnamed protein product [Calypogeia fissa]